MKKSVLALSSAAVVVAAGGYVLMPSVANSGTPYFTCALPVAFDGMQRADVSELIPLKPTRGEEAIDSVKVNSKQWTNFAVSTVNDTTFRVRVTNNNRYREKGNTFNNVVVVYDKCGTPLAWWHNKRGVGARGWAGYRTTHTDANYAVTENVVRNAAYVSFYSNNKGNSGRVAEWFKDVLHDGFKKGMTDLTAVGVKIVGAKLGIKA